MAWFVVSQVGERSWERVTAVRTQWIVYENRIWECCPGPQGGGVLRYPAADGLVRGWSRCGAWVGESLGFKRGSRVRPKFPTPEGSPGLHFLVLKSWFVADQVLVRGWVGVSGVW